jgi:hypothetical protein
MADTFGPNSCKPMIPDPVYNHRAVVHPDDGGPITFNWHWPRGTFDPRMSALELATFVLPHMPAILPFLASYPRVQAEFAAMLVRIATWPKEELDRLATWIKPVVRTSDDDLIQMSITCREEQPAGPTYFVQA